MDLARCQVDADRLVSANVSDSSLQTVNDTPSIHFRSPYIAYSYWQWTAGERQQQSSNGARYDEASWRFLPARRYASAVLAVIVCPSVRPSHVGVLLGWLNLGSRKQRHTTAQ